MLGRLRNFVRDAKATTAVEFGLVSLPFLVLLGGIVQVAFSIWAAQNLDFVLQKTARSIYTGQFQQSTVGITDTPTLLSRLRASMCSDGQSTMVFDCSAVRLDVTLGSSFASSGPINPVDPATKDWNTNFGIHYSCATPGAIVIATAAVKFPVFFNLLNGSFMDFSDGSKLLQSTAVFRTEPYAVGNATSC